jgi:hypothetical protein
MLMRYEEEEYSKSDIATITNTKIDRASGLGCFLIVTFRLIPSFDPYIMKRERFDNELDAFERRFL